MSFAGLAFHNLTKPMKHLSLSLLFLLLLVTSCHDSKDPGVVPITPPSSSPPSNSELPAQGSDTNHNFTVLTPRVISSKYDGPVLLEFRSIDGRSNFILNAVWGENIPLRDDGQGGDKIANDEIFSVTLDSKKILSNLASISTCRPFLGSISISVIAGYSNVFAEVSTDSIPQLTVEKVNDQVQKTPHLVNIITKGSTVFDDDQLINNYTNIFYQHFGDDYDFIVIIFPGFNDNRHHNIVKQAVTGLGMDAVDMSGQFGSSGKLTGISVFPNTTFLDGASVGYQHELGHQWINYLSGPFAVGQPHWPVSDLASGIMGYSGPGGEGLSFPYDLVQQDANNWKIVQNTSPTVFNDLELYLMGLQPASQVKDHIIFNDQTQAIEPGAILQGPVTKVSATDIVTLAGIRNPDYTASPKKFNIATIIVSSAFLSDMEMSFYDYFSARAELKKAIVAREGFSIYVSRPFSLSTGGAGELVTTLVN